MSHDRLDITPEDVSRIWPVALPVSLRRVALGTNNHSFIIDCDDHTYFLKSYDNAPDRERYAFEHWITAAIAAQEPPFAVPETIPSRFVETHILRDGRYYALSRFIPGSVARAGDPVDAFACWRALAELPRLLRGSTGSPGVKVSERSVT